MQTFYRLCKEDRHLTDEGKELTLKKGEKYLTSKVKDKKVTVFSQYWVSCPANWFTGALKFT